MNKCEQDRRILHTLAAADPDFATFQAEFPAAQNPADLDPEILQDTLAVLNEDPAASRNRAGPAQSIRDQQELFPRHRDRHLGCRGIPPPHPHQARTHLHR